MSVTKPPANQYVMKVLGTLMVIFSLGEIGVGTYVYRYMTNVHLGGWWGVVAVFFSGVLGMISNSRQVVTAGCFLAVFGVFTTIISGVIDGMAVTVFFKLISCENSETLKIYGSDDYTIETDLLICMNDESAGLSSHQCVCTDKSFCGYYHLTDSDNCGLIMTEYLQCLMASTILIGLSFIVVFIYSIVSCISVRADRDRPSNSSVPVEQNSGTGVEQTQQMGSSDDLNDVETPTHLPLENGPATSPEPERTHNNNYAMVETRDSEDLD